MLVLLFVLGACMGSFLCCQARRLHLRYSKHRTLGARSVCLGCGRQLEWYDNIPIISWIILGGKCRKCHRRIGIAEFLSEIGMALAFVGIGTTFDPWSANAFLWVRFVLLLCFMLAAGFLAIYDGLYGELPVAFLIIGVLMGGAMMVFNQISVSITDGFSLDLIYRPLIAVAILGGLYLVLYLVSKGKWVGDGDWILGVAIAMALFEPWLALAELFLANALASIVMLPYVIKKRKTKIYFGPFMVVAMVVVITFARQILDVVG